MSHNYPEIDRADIRKGDEIHWDDVNRPRGHAVASPAVTAIEYKANRDEHEWRDWGIHRLINRPTPPVELPEEPTLGWATWRDFSKSLAVWKLRGEALTATDSDGDSKGYSEKVTAFTPATAVPTEALDALRLADDRAWAAPNDQKNDIRRDAIEVFLIVVTEANS